MATDHKTIQPLEFYKTFLDRKSRPDGRSLLEFRKMTLNAGSIGTADGSAIVKCGHTTVVCGIKAELAPPEREEPTKGFIIPNVTLPPLCSSHIKSGPPGETAQAATQFIAELVQNNIIMDLESLCIVNSKWAWVLHCDLLCLNLDGSLLDACVMALVAALKNLTLPLVTYDEEADKLLCKSDEKKKFDGIKMPVTSTFSLFEDGILISDPTFEEEQLAAGLTSITMDGSSVAHMYKPGGCTLDESQVKKLIQQSQLKTKEVVRLIEEACSLSAQR